MQYERYESILISADARKFTFVSQGPRGQIKKMVQYTETDDPEIYNLAFGDLLPDGSIDDHVKNDNKRTRLYRMALTLNLEKLSVDFEIFGAKMRGQRLLA